ncbi:MAG TPA: ESPR domain-containing protein, partial [Candidatus Megamonas gallistercoris]|nr:ESPR domain-containing protein [Candidatus Megamonas gallistercoris]
MNRIYKVIWSKVKHQYVVVSELAHSNGKQSRTARKSLRSRIAALVVCGAIAAFGVYGALPTQQVFAAAYATSAGQYIAVKVPENTSDYRDMVAHEYSNGEYVLTGATGWNAPRYVKQTLTYIDIENGNKEVTAEFFVRKGYTLVAEYGERHDNSANNLQISAYKNADAPSNADNGLLTSTQVIGTASEYKTLVGQSLIDTSVGKFGGTVNSPSTGVTSGSAFYTAHSQLSYSDNFKAVNWDEKTKSYKYDTGSSQITVPKENVYVITNGNKTTAGVFVVDGQIYTGTVFGKNNEILTTATDDNGNYYSMWSAEIEDPNTPINLTKSQFEQAMKYQQDSIKTAAGNDIEKVVSNAAKDGNGGSIDLLRQGEYNVETGQYSTEKPSVNGTLSITNTGGTNGSGDDLKIKFQADGSDPFTVDAGSKVEAVTNGADSKSLTGLSINGEAYSIPSGGKSVTSGTIGTDGSVTLYQGEDDKTGITLTGKVQDWNVTRGSVDNNGKLTLNTENAYGGATDTVEINGIASTGYVDNTKTEITTAYENYFNTNDKYITGGTVDNASGTINLTGTKGLKATITGLESYVDGRDNYVTSGVVSDDGKKLTLTMKDASSFDIALPNFTEGLSSTDYKLVADPSGEYKVSADGKLTLKVQDINNPNAQPEDVAISGIAQKDYVDGQFNSIDKSITNIEGDITEINTTVDTHDQKLKHIEHHDGTLLTPDYTTVEGTDFYNDGSISSKVEDTSLLGDTTTNNFDFNKNGGSFTTEKETSDRNILGNGTVT